jgi:hypothetical protein
MKTATLWTQGNYNGAEISAPAIACIYRNLKFGTAWNAHTWSVALPKLKKDGTPGAGLGKVQGYTDGLLLLNPVACYKGDKLRAQVAQSRKREVFAWFRGLCKPSGFRHELGLRRGRRIGMNVKAYGEVSFCYADDRTACPERMAALLFTSEGLFEAVRAQR